MSAPKKNDPVHHPAHYQHPSGVECIQITQWFNFNVGNAIKYLWRHETHNAGALENLKKARQYIDFEINRLKAEQCGGFGSR